MADITMCSGEDCLRKTRCRRATAIPHPTWQSYFGTVPLRADGSCDHYWPVLSAEQEDATP